ncbi:MAG: helix-turn-helix domain-containing protein [Alphaproteobacteria bacterium]|nr:helix-turn-helix domain-containing protein [Alphaproteobacteria bacterium]
MKSTARGRFRRAATKGAFRYSGCGLNDIYLTSGFVEKETPRGRAVSIADLDGLHRAIGADLVKRRKRLNGREIRFLRGQMDLTQAELAQLIGCDVQQIARYEKDQNAAPGAADRLLRMMYREHLGTSVKVRETLEAIGALPSSAGRRNFFAATNRGWRLAA